MNLWVEGLMGAAWVGGEGGRLYETWENPLTLPSPLGNVSQGAQNAQSPDSLHFT